MRMTRRITCAPIEYREQNCRLCLKTVNSQCNKASLTFRSHSEKRLFCMSFRCERSFQGRFESHSTAVWRDYWFIIIIKLMCVWFRFLFVILLSICYFETATMSVYCKFFFSTVLYPPVRVWRINIPPRVGKYLTRLLDQSFTEIGLANKWNECFILEFDCVSSLALYLPLACTLCYSACAHSHTVIHNGCRQKCKIFTILLIV